MTFHETRTPEELARLSVEHHARLDAQASPLADQFDAEWAEVVRARLVAPRENKFLRDIDEIREVLRIGYASRDRNVEATTGPIPVIRLRPFFHTDGSVEYERAGSDPISNDAPIRYCHACDEKTPNSLPFWIAYGACVIQLDFCDKCAEYYLELGAKAQLGLPED
ncbi:hypothetical protein [Glaciihabitans sp. UYNi722]|uniref:hypothetical protein n=1 Tax=Glaciihabitans sp. UYNi722 TaxID=3156344 RepID=UPI00339B8990